jgi:excisionase family DNA binding protein
MDHSQVKVVELLREVHLIAIKEIDRLNLRIAELENQDSRKIQPPVEKQTTGSQSTGSHTTQNEIVNERELAAYLNISVSGVRRWRLLRKGPPFLKIGSSVRYRRQDVASWLESCSGAS